MSRDLSCKYLDRALMLTPSGEMRPCCRFDSTHLATPPMWTEHRSLAQHIESLEFSEWNERAKQGFELPTCQKCYQEEIMGLESMRQKSFPWKYENQVTNSSAGSSCRAEKTGRIEFLELSAGRTCNLKCRSCSALYSTKWDADARRIGMPIPAGLEDLPVGEISMELLKGLKGLKISGGEPLLNPQLLQFLTSMVNSGVSQSVHVQFYTNGTLRPNEKLLRLIPDFASWSTLVSVDAVDRKNTYLRHPADWQALQPTIQTWSGLSSELEDYRMTFAVTISIYNVLSLVELLSWAHTNYTEAFQEIILQPVLDPRWMSVVGLPNDVKLRVGEVFREQLAELNKSIELPAQLSKRIKRVSRMFDELSGSTESLEQFYQQTAQLDRIRNESFHETFPVMSEILQAFSPEPKIDTIQR